MAVRNELIDSFGSLPFKERENAKEKINQKRPGTNPIKILQHKFYSTKFFKHSDWILNIFNQSKSWKKFHIVKFML